MKEELESQYSELFKIDREPAGAQFETLLEEGWAMVQNDDGLELFRENLDSSSRIVVNYEDGFARVYAEDETSPGVQTALDVLEYTENQDREEFAEVKALDIGPSYRSIGPS